MHRLIPPSPDLNVEKITEGGSRKEKNFATKHLAPGLLPTLKSGVRGLGLMSIAPLHMLWCCGCAWRLWQSFFRQPMGLPILPLHQYNFSKDIGDDERRRQSKSTTHTADALARSPGELLRHISGEQPCDTHHGRRRHPAE